jgi:succinate dehydrogenase/fumarate reductase flavoprotein subunit
VRPIIVGTGLAGLWTAWRLAHEGRAAVILTKGTLADSASAWAQGGIAAAFGPGDSPALHAADTLAAGDGLGDPEAVRVLTTEGPDRIRQLITLGATFDQWPDRTLRLGLEEARIAGRASSTPVATPPAQCSWRAWRRSCPAIRSSKCSSTRRSPGCCCPESAWSESSRYGAAECRSRSRGRSYWRRAE